MRVCYFGTYRADYARNVKMIAGLRSAGVEVVTCHVPLWRDTAERVRLASGGWANPAIWLRMLRAYVRLWQMHSHVAPYDVMVVGYPGHLDVFVARLLSRQRQKPLVWDVLMSMYLIALDRGVGSKSPLSLRLLHAIEQRACRLPDRLIIDTPEYVDWLTRTYRLPVDRFRLVPLGVDDSLFTAAVSQPAKSGPFRVVYHGTFIPNHGVPTIVRAAELLRAEEGLVFQLIGEGPDRAAAQAYALEHNLQQVEFIEWMEGAALVEALARADVCLGAFGYTVQSLITVHNKIYEGMALARPVITGDSPAVQRAFRAGHEICLVPREDPRALADAIQRLRADPGLRARIAEGGRRVVGERYTLPIIGEMFAGLLREVVG